MSRFKCRHDWEIERGYAAHRAVGELSTLVTCTKCGVTMTASEAAQLGLWKHTVGIQKWLSIGAFTIAIASLLVSFLKP